MKQLKAFAVVFFLSIIGSVLITIAAMFFLSTVNPPQSGNFDLFSSHRFLVTILAGSIYGGAIGISIGVVSGIFYIAFFQTIESTIRAFRAIGVFSVAVGTLECLFFFVIAGGQSSSMVLVLYFFLSGFATAFLPAISAKVYFHL